MNRRGFMKALASAAGVAGLGRLTGGAVGDRLDPACKVIGDTGKWQSRVITGYNRSTKMAVISVDIPLPSESFEAGDIVRCSIRHD